MTALIPSPAADDAPTAPYSPVRIVDGTAPVAEVYADLMPDEVLDRRRLSHLKRRIAVAGVALVAVLGLGYALVRQQTSHAEADLHAADQRTAFLDQQVARFHDLVTTQSDTQQLTTQLAGAMTGDVGWSAVLASLQRSAPAGLRIGGVAGQLADATSAAPAAQATPAPSGSGSSAPTVVGSLTISGTTRSIRTVADYAAALAAVPGFTAVNPATTAVAGTGGGLTFTVTLSLASHTLRAAPGATPSPTASLAAAASTGGAAAPDAAASRPAGSATTSTPHPPTSGTGARHSHAAAAATSQAPPITVGN